MKLLKKILAVFTFLFVFTVMAVNMGVKADSLTYGTVSVNTTSYDGDTKVWGFTTNLPGSNTSIAVGNDINGIVSAKDGLNGTKTAVIQIKNTASNAYDTYPGAEFLVPVPSADSTGTVTRNGNANNSRYLALGSNSAVAISDGMTFDFTTSDIETDPTLSDNSTITGYYLRFIVSGGEAKTTGISVQLKDGATTYGAASVKHTMTYMDGTNELLVDSDAVDGSKVSYIPKKYGYTFEGWYTNASLDSQYKINSSYTVTGDATLYANWTAWTNTGIEEYKLSNSAIEKIATGIDGALTANLLLSPSIFTAMTGVSMTTTNVTLPGAASATQSPCFNTNGAVTTSGYGLKFTAPANGELEVWIGAGGNSARNIKMTDGTDTITPTVGEVEVPDSYAPHLVKFDVESGTTYYLGGESGVRIYYIEFSNIATQSTINGGTSFGTSTVDGTKAVRFVGSLVKEGITASDITSVTATISISESEKAATVKDVTTTVDTSIGTLATEAENTLYFYTSVYGFENTDYNTRVLTVVFNVTFTDGSTISKTLTYTINYAEM